MEGSQKVGNGHQTANGGGGDQIADDGSEEGGWFDVSSKPVVTNEQCENYVTSVTLGSDPDAASFEPIDPEFEHSTEVQENPDIEIENASGDSEDAEFGEKEIEERFLLSLNENSAGLVTDTDFDEKHLQQSDENSQGPYDADLKSEVDHTPSFDNDPAGTTVATGSFSSKENALHKPMLSVPHTETAEERLTFADSTPLPPADAGINENLSHIDQMAPEGSQSSKDAEQNSDTQVTEATEYQPIVAMPRPALRPTSWGSCCGLLDVLRRSD